MILQLDPPLLVETPRGEGLACFLIDFGMEHHLQWQVFLKESGESWVFRNPDIRLSHNLTMGRLPNDPQWKPFWDKANEFLKKERQSHGTTEPQPPERDQAS